MYEPSKHAGYNLIEILVVLTILGIISHFTVSNYHGYRVREHRSAAGRALIELSLALEEYAMANNTYSGVTLESIHYPALISQKTYRISIKQANTNYYLITAQPIHSQKQADQLCGTLSLDSYGRKFSSRSRDFSTCWL